MAALLTALAIMAVFLAVALPAWRQMVQREREDELIFRGQQYVRAIALFQRKFGPTFPPNVDVLVEQHVLRRKYRDPVNAGADFEILYQGSLATAMPGQGGGAARPGLMGPTGSGSSAPSRSSSSGRQGSVGGVPAGTGGLSAGTSGARSTSGAGLQLGPGSASGLGQRGGIVGVASKSTAKSVKLYNGRNYYNEWQFVFLATAGQAGIGGAGGFGVAGGIPGQPRGPGALPPTAGRGGTGRTGQRGGRQGPMGPGGQRGIGPGGPGPGGIGPGGTGPGGIGPGGVGPGGTGPGGAGPLPSGRRGGF